MVIMNIVIFTDGISWGVGILCRNCNMQNRAVFHLKRVRKIGLLIATLIIILFSTPKKYDPYPAIPFPIKSLPAGS